MFWKKIMSTALCAALLVTHAGMARAAVEETVQGKLAAVEEETWGGTQTGALVDRINRLEKDYLGIHNNGSASTSFTMISTTMWRARDS